MPQLHRMMGERLRRVEQGADTVVWLALSKAAVKTPRGQFFRGQWVLFFDRAGQNPDPGRKQLSPRQAGGLVRALYSLGQKPGWVLLLEAWV